MGLKGGLQEVHIFPKGVHQPGGKCPFSIPRNICLHQGDTSPLISVCQNLHPWAIKKPIKPNFQPDPGDHRFPGSASWCHATFPFSSLQIKLLWPCYSSPPLIFILEQTKDCHHPSSPAYQTEMHTSFLLSLPFTITRIFIWQVGVSDWTLHVELLELNLWSKPVRRKHTGGPEFWPLVSSPQLVHLRPYTSFLLVVWRIFWPFGFIWINWASAV
jgi:hypothetical protein